MLRASTQPQVWRQGIATPCEDSSKPTLRCLQNTGLSLLSTSSCRLGFYFTGQCRSFMDWKMNDKLVRKHWHFPLGHIFLLALYGHSKLNYGQSIKLPFLDSRKYELSNLGTVLILTY